MMAVYTKLGRTSPSGKLHAVTAESVASWDGPKAHCGEAMKATFQRLNGQETNCDRCREVLGLEPKKRAGK